MESVYWLVPLGWPRKGILLPAPSWPSRFAIDPCASRAFSAGIVTADVASSQPADVGGFKKKKIGAPSYTSAT